MADGTTFTIDVQAQNVGADATADAVLGLSDAIQAAERVMTPFDAALSAASSRLGEAAAAAEVAQSALAEAEAEYKRLERAATSAAKKVERAALKGKDTDALRTAAAEAAAAVTRQAAAVDQARSAADKAAAAQRKLADAYKTVERRAGEAAKKTNQTETSFGTLFQAAGALGGPLGGLAGKIAGIGDGLRGGGGKAGLILGAFAAGNALIAMAKAAVGLSVAIAGVVAGLLAFAIAADEATTKKLGEAWKQAQKDAKGLFEGVKTEKLLKPVQSLLNLLDENTSTGKALAGIFERILNPVIDGLVEGAPLAKEFFKGMVIGALQTIIIILRLRNAIVGAIPKETREKIKGLVTELFSLGNAAKLGEGTFKVLAVVAGALAVVLGVIVVAIAAVGLVIYQQIVVPAELAIQAITKLIESFSGQADKAQKAGESTGGSFGDGVVAGIKAAVAKVVEAAGNMANSAVAAIKEKLKIKSPSQVMRRIFEVDTGGAAASGLERAVPNVRRAALKIGRAAEEGTREGSDGAEVTAPEGQRRRAPRSPEAATSGGPSITVTLQSGAVVIHADGDEDAAKRFGDLLIQAVENAANQLAGGALVGATA